MAEIETSSPSEIGQSSSIKFSVESLQKELEEFHKVSRECSIYRVQKLLRQVNKEAYTPVLISIGPFHHNKNNLISMEAYKLAYLQEFKKEHTDEKINECIEIINKEEHKIRECYSEHIDMTKDEFVRMVLIDSIFIIQLFKTGKVHMPFTNAEVMRDLKLVENQLPFFILEQLFEANDASGSSFIDLARSRLKINKEIDEVDSTPNETTRCCHLLDLLRSHYLQSMPKSNMQDDHIMDFDVDYNSIHSPTATRLHEVGVKFCVSNNPFDLHGIKFAENTGTLTIPKLTVLDWTESLFRNITAFEQYHYRNQEYIAHYGFLMDCLINTKKDVRILLKAGIIDSYLGSEKEVATLINSLGKNIYFNFQHYSYKIQSDQLENYSKESWNRNITILKHTYFKHPWAIISFIFAIIFLLLTIVQVVAGVLAIPGVM